MIDFSEALITSVHVQGFRSLENVNVVLDPVTVFVGPNSSGKSSFLDALAFLQQSLTTSPDYAFERRGGINQILTRTGQRPRAIALEVKIQSRAPGEFTGNYFVLFQRVEKNSYIILTENCELLVGTERWSFTSNRGDVRTSIPALTLRLAAKALALPVLGRSEPFAHMLTALSQMSFYSLGGASRGISARSDQEGQHSLSDNPSHVADVLRRIRSKDEALYLSILDALCRIVPSIRSISTRRQEDQRTISFEEIYKDPSERERSIEFDASQVSAGTMHILNILLAIYPAEAPTLVALEEPETAVHPGAAAVLADAIKEAALRFQILVTTHSPDLITRFDTAALRAVTRTNGVTLIAPIDETQLAAIRQGLFTAGQLHQIEGLRPNTHAPQEAVGSA